MQIKYSMPSRLALRVVRCGVLCVSLLCNPWVFASSDLPPIVKLPIWPGSKDQTDFASWALKSPATESWQNWCDDGHDEFAEYDMYSFCSSYSPKLVLEDEFSQKVLRNVKAGTLKYVATNAVYPFIALDWRGGAIDVEQRRYTIGLKR